MLLGASTIGSAQIVDDVLDDPGDIAFIAYCTYLTSQATIPPGIAFVLMDNAVVGASVKIIDEEWNGVSFNSETGEGEITWTNNTGKIIPKGTVITIVAGLASTWVEVTANIGIAKISDAGYSQTQGSGLVDQAYAIAGTSSRANPKFLGFVGGIQEGATLDGTGLIDGETANIKLIARRAYVGPTVCEGTVKECMKMIYDNANWTGAWSVTTLFPAGVVGNFTGKVVPTVDLSTSKINAFPNPTAGIIELQGDVPEIMSIKLVNSLGQTFDAQFSNGRLDISNRPNGIYFVVSDNTQLNKLRIVKE